MFDWQKKMESKIAEIGIIPVIKLDDPADAPHLAQALIAGRVSAAEVTFRTEKADQIIRAMRDSFPEMLVGAGTVLTLDQVKLAIEAMAAFIVSPGYDEEIVSYCIDQQMPVFAGAITPTEIQRIIKHGLYVAKFFPASQYGGLATIKALSGPFPDMKFIPTGGISLENLGEYAADKRILACGGSYMVSDKLLKSRNWSEVSRLCVESVDVIKNARS